MTNYADNMADSESVKQRILFEGQLGDDPIDKVLPSLIEKAIELNDDVFLIWNAAILRINPLDTVDIIMKEYHNQLHMFDLYTQEKIGELITKDKLKEKAMALIDDLFK